MLASDGWIDQDVERIPQSPDCYLVLKLALKFFLAKSNQSPSGPKPGTRTRNFLWKKDLTDEKSQSGRRQDDGGEMRMEKERVVRLGKFGRGEKGE